jgi:very-short-patch-repair endonuclease
VVLQGYIADYYACAARLIVEVDGGWHGGRSRADARRDRVLAAAGYRVLRVAEQDVLSALPQVLARIRAAIEEAGSGECPGWPNWQVAGEVAFRHPVSWLK